MSRAVLTIGFVALAGLVSPASAQIFSDCLSNGAPISSTLPPVVESMSVGVDEVVLDVQTTVIITHTFQGDLEITLESPFGTSVMLHDNDGGSANDMNVIFTDGGVPNGSAPYTCGCAMQPSGPGQMADFGGQSSLGDWTLTVDDTLGGDDGTLDTWCLNLSDTGPPPIITDLSCMTEVGTGIIEAAWINGTTYDSIEVSIDGVLADVLPGSATGYLSDPQPVPGSATMTLLGVVAGVPTVPVACTVDFFPTGTMGPDVVYTDCVSITNWGQVGGIRAYSLGSYTCNIGDMNLDWGGTTPLLAMNAYRLIDGRIEQIGMSWVKNGTVAAAGSGCGLPCNGQGGGVLGAGCRDVYGSSYNGGQGILGPRSDVNAFTGAYPGASGSVGGTIGERLQVAQSDLGTPGALYFVEGVYVAWDDAGFGNGLNNASYKRVNVSGASNDLNPVGDMYVTVPAIYSWQDHGLGVNTPDPAVEIIEADVPSEGRFHVASKVTDLGGGQWRYDYAIFNLNSHRSGGSFSVPVGAGVNVTNVGFHDVDYHSGEPYDNTDWDVSVGGGSVTWSSPETYAENQNSNALRFGTLYSFWFDTDTPPEPGTGTLGLFRPGTPDSISFQIPTPTEGTVIEFVRGDCTGDGTFGLEDAIATLDYLFPVSPPGVAPGCVDACDTNDDGALDISDPIDSLNGLFAGGPPPAAPYPDCGSDPSADGLGCDGFPGCP